MDFFDHPQIPLRIVSGAKLAETHSNLSVECGRNESEKLSLIRVEFAKPKLNKLPECNVNKMDKETYP